jgi:sporulation protein YlmC with PRC-barrel domain
MTFDTTRGSPTGTAVETRPGTGWNLISADALEDAVVRGLNDEKIGTVDDVYIDYDEHTVRYATVDVGGFLGIGAKTVLVPFERLQWSNGELFLPVERELLEKAPEFDPQRTTYDRSYEEQLSDIWGVSPYWTGSDYGASNSHWREGTQRTL